MGSIAIYVYLKILSFQSQSGPVDSPSADNTSKPSETTATPTANTTTTQGKNYAHNMQYSQPYTSSMGSFTTLNDQAQFDVLSELRPFVIQLTSVFARNVESCFLVSGSKRTYTFRVLMTALLRLATLVRVFTSTLNQA